MEGVDISPATLLQSRSPSLDLDSLYGNGPADPARRSSTRPTASTSRWARPPAARRARTCRGRRGGRGRRGDHPRPAQRREPRRRADALRVHQVPQPRRRHAARLGPAGAAVPAGAQDRHEALPVDDPHRLPAADLRAGGRHGRLPERPQGVRGRRAADQMPTMPIEFSVAAFRLGHSMVRATYNWNKVFPNATLAQLFEFSHKSGGLPGPIPSIWIADFRRLFNFGQLTPPKPALVVPPASSTRRCGSTRSSSSRSRPCRFPTRAGEQPRVPQPAAGEHGEARDGPADGDVPEEQGRHDHEADKGADQGRERRRHARALSTAQRDAVLANTPLWFYILREAELNSGELKGVGRGSSPRRSTVRSRAARSRSSATRRSGRASARTTPPSGWSTS